MGMVESIAALRQMAQYLGLYCTEFSETESRNYYTEVGLTQTQFVSPQRSKINITFEFYEDATTLAKSYKQMSYQNASSHQWKKNDEQANSSVEKQANSSVEKICNLF